MRRPLLLALTGLLCLAPAARADNPTPPTATTGSASALTQTTAHVAGSVNPDGADTTVQFQYGTSTSYGLTSAAQTVPSGTAAVEVGADLSRLTTATTYHYRVVATNSAGVTRGDDRTFRTASAPQKPGVVTVSATGVGADGATLTGRVDPNAQSTQFAFQYGTTTRYGQQTAGQDAGSGDGSHTATAAVTGLSSDTTYHFRITATNATGTTVGGDHTFRTTKSPLRLTLVASPNPVRYGVPVSLTVAVAGGQNTGVAVLLQRHSSPFSDPFAAASTVTTDGSGLARFTITPFTLATEFRATVPTRGNATSNVVRLGVRAAVSAKVRHLSHRRVRFTGSVSPGGATGLVSLQRKSPSGRYVTVKRSALLPKPGVARYTITITGRRTASTYRIATRLTSGGLLDGRSSTRRVRGSR